MWHDWDMQMVIVAALKNATITDDNGVDVSANVFDNVPKDHPYPYISMGNWTAIDAATKSKDGHQLTITLHIWSQYSGRKEVKNMMAQVYEALHNKTGDDIDVGSGDQNTNVAVAALTRFKLVNLRHEFSNDMVESDDGRTRHGVMRFRAVVFDN